MNFDVWEALLVNVLFEKGDLWVLEWLVASIFPIELIAQLDVTFLGGFAAAVDWGILWNKVERIDI